MPKMPIRTVGIAWYHCQDYRRILQIMEDAHVLPRTYHQWLTSAEAGERQLQSTGHTVIRAMIDPDEFTGWCRARGLKIDAQARSQFGGEAASRQVGHTH